MSDTLATAVIGEAIYSAMKGGPDAELAWRFLTEPNPLLELWCGHLGVPIIPFCVNMERIRKAGDREALQKAWRAFRAAEGQRITEEKRKAS
jgi:hypothetical protein